VNFPKYGKGASKANGASTKSHVLKQYHNQYLNGGAAVNRSVLPIPGGRTLYFADFLNHSPSSVATGGGCGTIIEPV